VTPRKEFKPRKYQPLIIDHVIAHQRCAVWAGMGMGKTVSVLTAIDLMQLTGIELKPALVIAPLRVAKTTWPEEVAQWAHLANLRVVPLIGNEMQRVRAMREKAQVYTINYENLPWLLDYHIATKTKWPYGTIVADESTKLKGLRVTVKINKKTGKEYVSGQGAKRAKAIAKIAHHTNRWINLTGTPAPNGLMDLWGQTWFIDKGVRLGRSFTAFADRWFKRDYSGYKWEALPHAQGEVQKLLSDVCLYVDPKDYFNLADPIITPVYVELPPNVRKHYNAMERALYFQLETGQEVEAFNAAARSIKCLQLAQGAVYTDTETKAYEEVHDEKLSALEDIIEEAAGMPVVVAYHFRPDLIRLQKHFKNARVLDNKPQTQRDWNAGKIPILLTHPESAGHGLNLQHGGNIIVFYGHWWNLESYLQVVERIGPVRQLQSGYDRPVFIYNIIAKNTVDEDVIESRINKNETMEVLKAGIKKRQGGKV